MIDGIILKRLGVGGIDKDCWGGGGGVTENVKLICGCIFRELLEMTCRVANVLKRDGVKKGDRVAIYMPVSPLLVASMLACARIGAIHRYGWVRSG